LGKSIKFTLTLLLLVSVVCGGFYWGRALGAGSRRSHHPHGGLANLLPFRTSFAGGAEGQDFNPNTPPDKVFEDVLDHVRDDFVEGGGSDSKLSNAALTRMLASLDDPKTSFLDQSMRQTRQNALKGRFHGIGAVLTVVKRKKDDVDYRYLTVVDVMPNSPAERAGLKSGDRLTEIDGRWIITYSIAVDAERIYDSKDEDETRTQKIKDVNAKFQKGYNLTKAMTQLVTGEGRPLQLTVERPGQAQPISVSLKTAVTEVEPVEFRVLNGKIGYLRIRQFNARATQEFQNALDKMEKNLKGLILDLRGNPGGVRAEDLNLKEVDGFVSARKLMARLTRGGNVALIERKPKVQEPLTITGTLPPLTLPKIVLVDQGTANLSEMVAAALRDVGSARIAGTHTFGDDVLQLFAVFKSGAGIEMTTAHLLTAKGADLNRGVEPDFPTPAGAETDAALKIALSKLGA
jgi:carboxyl-terminal processing protease